MGVYMDLKGTTQPDFQLGKGGPKFQNTAGDIHFHAPNLIDYVDLFANVLRATGNEIVLNANAPGTGSNRTYTLKRPTSGMSQAIELHLPPTYGSSGQFLKTDGAGNLSWDTAGGGGGGGSSYFVFSASNSTALNYVGPQVMPLLGRITEVRAYVQAGGGAVTIDVTRYSENYGPTPTTTSVLNAPLLFSSVTGFFALGSLSVDPQLLMISPNDVLQLTFDGDTGGVTALSITITVTP